MKRIRSATSLALAATLSGVLTAPVTSNAEWIQNPIGVPRAPGCDPGYSWQKVGVRYQCVTPQPSCAYGFASGPSWDGSTWLYSCNAPLPPACQSGYTQSVAPSWNGSEWVGQQCTPSAPALKDPRSQCQTRATQDGITLSPENVSRRHTYNSYAGPATQYYYDTSTGPNWQVGGSSGNSWTVVCSFVNATGDWVPAANNQYVILNNVPYESGGGG
jgi:hypothetical protein